MMLHSVTLQSATTARVGDDYIPSASRPKNVCLGASDIDARLEVSPPKGFGSAVGSAGERMLDSAAVLLFSLFFPPFFPLFFSFFRDPPNFCAHV